MRWFSGKLQRLFVKMSFSRFISSVFVLTPTGLPVQGREELACGADVVSGRLACLLFDRMCSCAFRYGTRFPQTLLSCFLCVTGTRVCDTFQVSDPQSLVTFRLVEGLD